MGELFENIKEKIAERLRRAGDRDEEVDMRDDFETRDKALKSMRRQVRRLMDEKEKEKLGKVIRDAENRRGIGFINTENSMMDDKQKFMTFKKGKKGSKLI